MYVIPIYDITFFEMGKTLGKYIEEKHVVLAETNGLVEKFEPVDRKSKKHLGDAINELSLILVENDHVTHSVGVEIGITLPESVSSIEGIYTLSEDHITKVSDLYDQMRDLRNRIISTADLEKYGIDQSDIIDVISGDEDGACITILDNDGKKYHYFRGGKVEDNSVEHVAAFLGPIDHPIKPDKKIIAMKRKEAELINAEKLKAITELTKDMLINA